MHGKIMIILNLKLLKNRLFFRISYKLDGSENILFKRFDKLNEQGLIEQDFSNEEMDNENNIILMLNTLRIHQLEVQILN